MTDRKQVWKTTSRILQRTVYSGKWNACTDASEKVRSQKCAFEREKIARFGNNWRYQKSHQPFLSIIDLLRKSDQRTDEIEFAINKIGAYNEESFTNFQEYLTEAIKDSTEKMMRCFHKPSQPSDDTGTEQVPLFCGSKFIVAKTTMKVPGEKCERCRPWIGEINKCRSCTLENPASFEKIEWLRIWLCSLIRGSFDESWIRKIDGGTSERVGWISFTNIWDFRNFRGFIVKNGSTLRRVR